jgi:hypothetical protein
MRCLCRRPALFASWTDVICEPLGAGGAEIVTLSSYSTPTWSKEPKPGGEISKVKETLGNDSIVLLVGAQMLSC